MYIRRWYPGEAVIEVSDLVFEYSTKRALHGVSVAFAPHTITALVGPNGAGKSTLLRCLAALERPFSGSVRVDGLDTRDKPRDVHTRLGFLPDFYGLYDELTVHQCFLYAARSRGITHAAATSAVAETAEKVGLSGRKDVLAGQLSRGYRQRLAIGQTIVHRPKVVILDEPAAGLDPEARDELSRLLLDLKSGGLTIIVSSHILAELESYSDAMVVLHDGRIVSSRNVHRQDDEKEVMVLALASPGDAVATLTGKRGVSEVLESGREITFTFEGDVAARAELLRELIQGGLNVAEFRIRRQGMQDIYLAEVKRARTS